MSDVQLLVLARCLGFVFRAPGFSHPDVPPLVRAAFAYALALSVAPRPAVSHLVPAGLVFAFASELALGAAIGTAGSGDPLCKVPRTTRPPVLILASAPASWWTVPAE